MITCRSLGRYGRFANQLYQIAGIIGIAKKSGQPYCFPLWRNYDHLERFGSTEDIDLFKHLVNPLPEYVDIYYQERGIGWGYHDVTLNGNWDLSGHFQSPKYFEHCIDEVREQLRFTNEPELNDYCAVHFRAGDYDPDPNAYHPRMSPEYYKDAIKLIPEGTRFMIFSDDLEAAKEVFKGHNVEYSTAKDYIEDYKQMKACKHFIIANSSYSAFAATMANQDGKIVVAPKKWFGLVAGINGDDIYERNWRII
jgi:hypothetical protein